MKKKLLSLLALVLVLSTLVAMCGFARKKEGKFYDRNVVCGNIDLSMLHVRVNGSEVEFTDAHPYIDENNRTMIPLRAAVEALGAEVTWDQATRTASIAKNGITVHVTIDKETIAIEKDGTTTYTAMDTQAVLNSEEGRTYVPIRYVAEALGAFVDYSDAFRTVGIYQDQLTPDEIRYLQSFTWDLAASIHDDWDDIRGKYSRDFEHYWPYYDVTPLSFANARECLYDRNSEKELSDALEIALSTLNYQSDLYSISFRSDASCILTADDGYGIEILLRGYLSCSGWTYERGKDYSDCQEEANKRQRDVAESLQCGLNPHNRNAYFTTEDWSDGDAKKFGDYLSTTVFENMPVEILLYKEPSATEYVVTRIILLENPVDYVTGGYKIAVGNFHQSAQDAREELNRLLGKIENLKTRQDDK